MKRPLIYNVVVCYSVVASYLDEHYHRKREGRAMPKFGQLFAQLLDLEEYEKIVEKGGYVWKQYLACISTNKM